MTHRRTPETAPNPPAEHRLRLPKSSLASALRLSHPATSAHPRSRKTPRHNAISVPVAPLPPPIPPNDIGPAVNQQDRPSYSLQAPHSCGLAKRVFAASERERKSEGARAKSKFRASGRYEICAIEARFSRLRVSEDSRCGWSERANSARVSESERNDGARHRTAQGHKVSRIGPGMASS